MLPRLNRGYIVNLKLNRSITRSIVTNSNVKGEFHKNQKFQNHKTSLTLITVLFDTKYKPHIPSIDAISSALVTLSLSIQILNSQCEEGVRDGIDIWYMGIIGGSLILLTYALSLFRVGLMTWIADTAVIRTCLLPS